MAIRNIRAKIFAIFLALLVCFGAAMGGQGNLSAYASTDIQTAYENTDVLENLEGATIGGKMFDLVDYPHNSDGKPQMISFVEFCYSYYADKQFDYGLYVYVYNPQDIAVDMATDRNKIQFSYGDAGYFKYTLEFLNYSKKAGYEGRFYKFKVKLSDSQRETILKGIDENERVYNISGIEISVKGTVTEYVCAQTYTYTGFAEGYGSELAQGDTLSCKVDGFEKYLTLDVRLTYYRPDGSNGSEYKQDTLHSVYFSVPNEIIREYGEMTAVHATWLNAYTNPILVTGNEELYEGFSELVGKESPETDYAFHTNEKGTSLGGFYFTDYSHGYNYTSTVESVLTKLNYVFYAENGNADDYTLPAEELVGDRQSNKKGWFETYTEKFGGPLVNDRFSAALFASADSSFTDKTITNTDTFSLMSVTTSQNLWQKIWGTSTSYTNTYRMSAIQDVTYEDMENAASKSAFCDAFYVAESDYDELYSYVKTAKVQDETVYLFRYYQSEYFAVELSEGVWETGWYTETVGDMTRPAYGRHYEGKDTNAYLCQMWVQLDFDIIDLTFTKDGVDTVIPVVMSPMDIAADAAPPLITTIDGKLKWWQILLGIIALITVVLLLFKSGPLLIYALLKVILIPFQALGGLVKKLSEAAKRRKKEKNKRKNE